MALVTLDSARFEGYRSKLSAAAAQFSAGQKAVVLIAAIGALVAGIAFYHQESKPSYGVLFTNLDASDAGAVVSQLQSSRVPYELSAGGSTVLVPSSRVDTERVVLAQKGLPSGGTVGFSSLFKTGLTSSDFVQQVEYQQALEGQLASTIESIQGVQVAKVSLALPQQSPFALGGGPAPSASILVGLAPGATLSSSEVQAVVHLTASTVPDLAPSAVTVVDNHGDVLTAPGATTGVSDQQQQTLAYDQSLSSSIQSLLDRVVGAGNAAVAVHATLDFSQVTTSSHSVQTLPGGKALVVPTSQSTTQQTYTGTATPPSGILGAGQPTATQNGKGTYVNRQTQTTNAVGQVDTRVQQSPGAVQATTVAVLVDSRAARAVSSTQIRSLVAAAAGLSPAQARAVSVAVVPFANPPAGLGPAAVKAAAAAARARGLRRDAEVAALLVGLAVLLALAWRTARRRAPAYEEIPVPQLDQVISVPLPPTEVVAPPTAVLPALTEPGEDLDRYIEDNPGEVGKMLRAWALERRRPDRVGS
ncbi:MAG: flagellar basal-body MS-ring/collar protein FliF [Actinomycetota bacterium]|nr:flagellar basal-body MS-ring/collar protein FliF [Actinomycetota bacterium]